MSFTVRIAVALVLLIGFHVLVVGVAVLLLLVPYFLWTRHGVFDTRVAAPCWLGAAVLLDSLRPRLDYFLPPGPRLKPEAHPRLFRELEDVASRLGEEMPASVFAIAEPNAWVMQRGGRGGFGGQRVLALGLPLLQALSVSELRGVFAHELGHFHHGDTRLGPWIHRTRRSLGETIGNLLGGTPMLVLLSSLFRLYARVFLLLTAAIGRKQELHADRLAADLVGARTLASALRSTAEAGVAFRRYLVRGELFPLVNAGLRPPLLEGFARFRRAEGVDEEVTDDVDEEVAAPRTSPYDTHPPLRDRLAALEDGGGDEPRDSEPRAVSLLDDLAPLEVSALAHLTDRPLPVVRKLAPFAWDALGTSLVLPRWRAKVQEHAAALAGTTPEQLAASAAKLEEVGRRFGRRDKVKALSPVAARRAALVTYGAALGAALVRAGWTVQAEPGGRPRLVRGKESLDPAALLEQLEAGELTAKAWGKTCATAGIAGVDLGALAPA